MGTRPSMERRVCKDGHIHMKFLCDTDCLSSSSISIGDNITTLLGCFSILASCGADCSGLDGIGTKLSWSKIPQGSKGKKFHLLECMEADPKGKVALHQTLKAQQEVTLCN